MQLFNIAVDLIKRSSTNNSVSDMDINVKLEFDLAMIYQCSNSIGNY